MKTILASKDLAKNQRKALISSKEHTEYIIEPKTLDPLISTYEKSNKALQLENASLRTDTTRLCDALETMIKDNSKLREFITKKNEDIGKTMSTLAQEEGEYISGLKDNISIIEEENKHLLFKVEQLEELLQREKEEHEDLQRVLNMGKQDKRRLKEDLDEIKLRDKGNNEKLIVLNDNLKRFEDMYEKEKAEKEKYRKELDDMKNREQEKKLKALSSQIEDQFPPGDYNELSQEVVFLREENEFLKNRLQERNNKPLKKENSKKEDNIGNLVKTNERIKELENEKEKVENLYKKTLKKLRILQSLDSDIAKKDSNEILMKPNSIEHLKEQLRVKNNELITEKKQNKDYIKELEKINNDLVKKLNSDNKKLKSEKNDLLGKLNQLMDKNAKTSQQLDMTQIYLKNDASLAKIKSLEEDNNRLRKELSDLRKNNFEDENPKIDFLNLQRKNIQKDKEYGENLQKLHSEIKQLQGERINQQNHIEKQNNAIQNIFKNLEKEKKDKKILSTYIRKFQSSLEEKSGGKLKYPIPDILKNHMDPSEIQNTETPRSTQSNKLDIQNDLRRSHHEDETNSKKEVRFADDVKPEEEIVTVTMKNQEVYTRKEEGEGVPHISREEYEKKYKLPDGRIVGEEEYQIYLENLKSKGNVEISRPQNYPNNQYYSQGVTISEQGVKPYEGTRQVYEPERVHRKEIPRPYTHTGGFYSPRMREEFVPNEPYGEILPPPLPRRRRRSRGRSHSGRRSPEIYDNLYVRDAREIVSNAYDRTIGRGGPESDYSSDFGISRSEYGGFGGPRSAMGDSFGGGINDLIRRYNETDLYNHV